MNKSMLTGVVAGIGIATAGAVMAAYAMRAQGPADEIVVEATTESMYGEEGTIGMPESGAHADAAVANATPEAPAPAAPAKVASTPAPAAQPVAQSKPAKKTKATTATAPVAAAAQAPREECWDEVVTHTEEPKDEHRIAGTVIGGVVGAAVGSQFGGGSGKTLATVAGAAGGAYAGNRAQKAVQENNTYTTTERRCKTVQ